MPYNILVQTIIGIPPPYSIYLCEPGPTNCILVDSGLQPGDFPYTISPVPPPFDVFGTPFVISAVTEDFTYTGNCSPNQTFTTDPCVVFLVTNNPNNVLIYDLPTDGKTFIYQLFTGQLVTGEINDIAVDSTNIFLLNNSNQIFKYSYILSPFSATHVTTFTIGGSNLDPCLEIYDNNSLMTARGNNYLLIDKSTGSVSTSISKPSSRTIHGIMVSYAPSGTKIFSVGVGNQTIDWQFAQQNYNTGSVEFNVLTTQSVSTLFQYGNSLYSNKSFLPGSNSIDYYSNYFPYGPINYSFPNIPGIVSGAAKITTCNNFELTSDPRPNVVTQGCINDSYAPPIILNGILVTYTSTGDVQFPNSYSPLPASCSGTLPSVFGNPLVGFSSQFTYTYNFSSPVNGAVLTIKGTGQLNSAGPSTSNEIFTITTNGGNPTITTITSCETTVINNVISSGAFTTTNAGSGGRFIINAPGTYTTLTVSGPQNVWAGSILQICI